MSSFFVPSSCGCKKDFVVSCHSCCAIFIGTPDCHTCENAITCLSCNTGYYGPNCDSCAIGYIFDGGICKLCLEPASFYDHNINFLTQAPTTVAFANPSIVAACAMLAISVTPVKHVLQDTMYRMKSVKCALLLRIAIHAIPFLETARNVTMAITLTPLGNAHYVGHTI